MMLRILSPIALVAIASFADAADTQPYAGQQQRTIASLSAQDVDDLLAGRGWGLAKAAELNGYPGPAHVLELTDALALSDEQIREVQDIFDRMQARAQDLGAAYVAAEAALDAAFRDGSIAPDTLAELVSEAGRRRAELRAVHLAAHLDVAPILTRHQIMIYNQARGYAGGHQTGHGHGHNHD